MRSFGPPIQVIVLWNRIESDRILHIITTRTGWVLHKVFYMWRLSILYTDRVWGVRGAELGSPSAPYTYCDGGLKARRVLVRLRHHRPSPSGSPPRRPPRRSRLTTARRWRCRSRSRDRPFSSLLTQCCPRTIVAGLFYYNILMYIYNICNIWVHTENLDHLILIFLISCLPQGHC